MKQNQQDDKNGQNEQSVKVSFNVWFVLETKRIKWVVKMKKH